MCCSSGHLHGSPKILKTVPQAPYRFHLGLRPPTPTMDLLKDYMHVRGCTARMWGSTWAAVRQYRGAAQGRCCGSTGAAVQGRWFKAWFS
jgi:hypothetical protein